MSGAPRPEPDIQRDLDKKEQTIAELEARAERYDQIREILENTLAAAEEADLYGGRDWRPPEWAAARSHVWNGTPGRAAEELRQILVGLAELEERGGVGRFQPVPHVLPGLAPDVDWPNAKPRDSEALEWHREQLTALTAELEFRRQGPGERRPYRLLLGKHSRFEDGKPVIYKKGAVIECNAWEAANLGEHRVELLGDS